MKNTLFISFILSFALSIKADVIPPRFGSKCAFTFNKIYCYGGKLDNKQYNNDMYELDLGNLPQGAVSNLVNNWTLVTPDLGPGVPPNEYRYNSQFVLLPDGSLFFDGGYNEDNPLVARNITYNPKNNTWTVLPGLSYSDTKNGGIYRQIYSAGAVYLPDTKSIAFFGGRELNAVLNTTYASFRPLANLTYETNSEQDPTKKLANSIYGYGYITELNVNTREWTSRKTQPMALNDFPTLISDLTATYHPRTKAIIYLGGFFKNQLLEGSTESFGNFLAYDTESSLWNVQPTNGLVIPTARLGHTATLLNTGDNILMYGGILQTKNESLEGKLSPDYLFDLDLNTFTWSVYNRPSDSLGPRAFHSAVLVNETSLLIMFGKKASAAGPLVAANNIMVLNVTDRSLLTSLDTYPNPMDVDLTKNTTTNEGQSESQFDGESKGLSGGAIAGIVIGIVALVAIIALAAIYHKKNKSKKDEMKELQVDWDEIDGGYRDVSPFGAKFSGDSTNMSNTVVPPDISEENQGQSSNAYSPALANSTPIKPDIDQGMRTKITPNSKE
ncbi:uncharacterized protein EV154DRAFT_600475 [Mucor mucedo]|uniref:uncharacterized protein n=1 Tax=Mucor mucedo TaxID=29922 RepID=UPI00221F4BD6|nr:uncharacterized protein EV154DRAFT_600475 [Mucor mucedo]KAI7893857.1 hypothetical protein EV154DRAFT_600475 [Mucor mucedo]